MIQLYYKPTFVKQYRKYSVSLQMEIKEKISLFKENPSHSFLKTHKLKGKFEGCFSFSVNYSHRIVFQYLSKTEVALLAVGTHDVYE